MAGWEHRIQMIAAHRRHLEGKTGDIRGFSIWELVPRVALTFSSKMLLPGGCDYRQVHAADPE